MVSSLHKKGETEKTFQRKLPKEIKAALDPFEGIQLKENDIQLTDEGIAEIEKRAARVPTGCR